MSTDQSAKIYDAEDAIVGLAPMLSETEAKALLQNIVPDAKLEILKGTRHAFADRNKKIIR